MPAISLCGVRIRHLSSDFFFFYFIIALCQVIWLVIYAGFLAHDMKPLSCTGTRNQHWAGEADLQAATGSGKCNAR